MQNAYFHHLPEHICHYIAQSRRCIKIAVCWFSHRGIFQCLLECLHRGIPVELILEYDSQNIKEGGLDFQKFIRCSGQLWAYRSSSLMHHKFALIDDEHLLTGSFNWTYNSNAENMLSTNQSSIVEAYVHEYEQLKTTAKRTMQIRTTDVKSFSAFPIFENTAYPLHKLRKMVSTGSSVWTIRVKKYILKNGSFYSNSLIPFDSNGHLSSYWKSYRIWDKVNFETSLSSIKNSVSNQLYRELHCFLLRMKIGELIFAIEKPRKKKHSPIPAKAYISAIGIVQSEPLPFEGGAYSTYRSVQWLRIFTGSQQSFAEKISPQSIARYQGSALRVLQELFTLPPHSETFPITD